jgi:hypothetical protein
MLSSILDDKTSKKLKETCNDIIFPLKCYLILILLLLILINYTIYVKKTI